ncbi:MAG TPA: caspase family protein, partial [Thermotogota bacterium]|nr:caspase family protein [Thermotogota bacterium]
VGFLDAPGIFLLDPQTLQTTSLVADSTRGNQTWHHVFWTKSGGTLFACSYGADPSFSWWNQAGAGERHTASLGTQLLKAIDLGEGRVAFCTEKPSLGVFSLDSEEILQLQAPIAFGGAIDPYGMWLEERSGRLFLPQPDGNTLLCLDTNFSTLSLFDLSSTPGSLPILGTTRLPRVFCDTLPLTVDAHFRSILFRGQPLCLEPGETTSCLCIFPDDSGFAVGSNWNVRTFDALGNPLWVFSAPAGVLSLQVSSQAGAVFASLADGTVRRFDLDTGEEHQTWLVSSEMEWLCVQQNGEIRHSSRGWQLGGWHTNRGPAQTALFEPLQPLPAPQTPAIAPVPQPFPPEPQRIFAVLCAVEDGSSTQPALRYVKDDARAMRTMLQNYSARRKIPLHTFELENESVSHEALEGVFGQIAGQCGPHDALLFFFAGHASYSPGAGGVPLFQLLAPNFSGEGLALTTLAGWLEKPPLSRALLLFDCCYSGCASDFFAGCSALSDLSLAVFTSSSPLQKSPELDSLGHGLLSASILDAMCSPGANLFHPGFVAGLFQSHARLQTTFPQDPVPLGFFVRP